MSYITIANNTSSGNYYIAGTAGGTVTSNTWATTSSTYPSTGSGLTVGSGGIAVSGNNNVVISNLVVDGSLGAIEVSPNTTLKLPDGHIIEVDDLGNFEILDDDAQVTYKANNVLEFNKYINASDLLEAFIKDLGHIGIKQGEVLNVPIELFINWIILKAAEQDGDNAPADVPRLESSVKPTKHPKCLCCGKFIKKKLVEHKIHFCNPEHHHLYLHKVGI